MSYKRILVPVDGSDTAARGMAEAIELARDLRAKLLLLHVVDEYVAYTTVELGTDTGPMLNAFRAQGQRTLESIASTARAAGAQPETLLVESLGMRVAERIIEEAVRREADLIVMGTHGRRGVKRALLGSDAEMVARYSPVPVMLVPHAGRKFAPVERD